MADRKQMTDDEVLAEVELRESQCGNIINSEVAREQATAMDYYLSKPFGTEEEGRSAVVSSDVWDVVEGLTPLVLKPFVSTDDIVRFKPEGPDDEEQADQESDVVNYYVTQKNNIFETLLSWVKTGLLQKNGVVKYWWKTSKRTSIERYDDVSDDAYALMIQDENVHVVQHTEKQGPPDIDPQTGQPGAPAMLHDVVLRVSEEVGEPTYAVIPPEAFRISRDATSSDPKSASFVEHVERKTIGELREMGYDVKDDLSDTGTADSPDLSEQYTSRRPDSQMPMGGDNTNDPASREVWYREILTLMDVDGDGMAELRKICVVGKTILANEETEEINFVGWTPYPQPFQFDGRCPADETTEIQLIKSTVLRQTMDNIYTVNNNTRYVSDKVNLDDLLDNQIAGIVRVKGDIVSNHVMPGPVTPIGAITMPMIEYFDSAKENRTGFTRYNQGTDSDSLNKTATGIRIIAEAGNERVNLVSRCFAEQGLKPLMLGIHGLCRRHGTKTEAMKLRGKWVEVNPRDWKTRYDMSVSVGLGSSDKQIQMQGAQLLLQTQANMTQIAPGLVTPKNFYEAGSMLAKSLGEKNVDKFFTQPPTQPQPPPDPTEDPAFKLDAAKVQLDAHKVDEDSKFRERELNLKELEIRLKAHQTDVDTNVKRADLHFRAQDMQMKGQDSAHAKQMDTSRFGHEVNQAQISNQQAAQAMEPEQEDPDEAEESKTLQMFAQALQAMTSVLEQMNKPRTMRVKKDADGSFVGVHES